MGLKMFFLKQVIHNNRFLFYPNHVYFHFL